MTRKDIHRYNHKHMAREIKKTSIMARIFFGHSREQAKDTGLAGVLVCLLLAWWTGLEAWLFAGMGVLLVAMTLPDIFRPLAFFWFGLAELLGSVVGRVLLGLLFFLLILPVGLLRRAFGADSLKLKSFGRGQDSVFSNRENEQAGDMERPF